MKLIVGRYQYMEGMIYFLIQDMGVEWEVVYIYIAFTVRDQFRFQGGSQGISRLDQEILSHTRDIHELQLTASTRMRDLNRATFQPHLLAEARAACAPTKPKAAPVKPQEPKPTPKGGDAKAEGVKTDVKAKRVNKHQAMAEALGLKKYPETGEAYAEWRVRMETLYVEKFGEWKGF